MTRTDILPAFDAALQPIGYALAAELLATPSTHPHYPAQPAETDLFGWELMSSCRLGASTTVQGVEAPRGEAKDLGDRGADQPGDAHGEPA